MDIYKLLHTSAAEYIFFAGTPGIVTKFDHAIQQVSTHFKRSVSCKSCISCKTSYI